MRRCRTCAEEKPLSEFHASKHFKDGLESQCKECKRATARKWREDHPDKVRTYWRRAALKRLYGITIEEYDQLLADQGGGCGICGQLNSNVRMMHVDHDHETGKVRGILCLHCNVGIGQLRHSVEILESAIEYCLR